MVFSNTGRAHELGKTDDWVIVYFHDDTPPPEGQRTVVTETSGRLAGRRVIRGRESECWAVYGISESSRGMDGKMQRFRKVGVARPEARMTTLTPRPVRQRRVP